MSTAIENEENEFHAHLDECRRCREEIFNLCPIGEQLLMKVASAINEPMFRNLLQWNKAVRRQP